MECLAGVVISSPSSTLCSFPCKTAITLIEKKTEINNKKTKLRRNGEFSLLAFLPLSMDDPCPVAPLYKALTPFHHLCQSSHFTCRVWVNQEEGSSFVTLSCYRINFSQAHSIRVNTSSVKEGQSSPLRWPSEKKCVLGKLMKWKVLYYAAKSPCHVATRTAGCDSDSVFMSDACVGEGC